MVFSTSSNTIKTYDWEGGLEIGSYNLSEFGLTGGNTFQCYNYMNTFSIRANRADGQDGTAVAFFWADEKYNLHRKLNQIINFDTPLSKLDSYPLRHGIVFFSYKDDGSYETFGKLHQGPLVAFNAGSIGQQTSVTIPLTLTVDNQLPSTQNKKITVNFSIIIKKNDKNGYTNIKPFDRSVKTFNLKDYAQLTGGFTSAYVTGMSKAGIYVSDAISALSAPPLTLQFILKEMRGSYKNGCGLGQDGMVYVFIDSQVYQITDAGQIHDIDCTRAGKTSMIYISAGYAVSIF